MQNEPSISLDSQPADMPHWGRTAATGQNSEQHPPKLRHDPKEQFNTTSRCLKSLLEGVPASKECVDSDSLEDLQPIVRAEHANTVVNIAV